jgi:hypothetical protein
VKRTLTCLAMAALAACGTAQTPVAVPTREIPFRLSRDVEPIRPPTRNATFKLSFVRRGKLVAVPREASVRLSIQETALRALFDGPSDRERQRGITTEIPEGTRLLTVRVLDHVAEVNLSREFQTPAPSGSILLRVAEVVRTITAVHGIDAVRFSIDGEPVNVVTDSGRSVARPVSPLDYGSVIASPAG